MVSLSQRVAKMEDYKLWETADDIRIATYYMSEEEEALVVRLGETRRGDKFSPEDRRSLENIVIGAVDSNSYKLVD